MTFSLLLPTRNRAEYLRFAIETILRQDDGDWEIVVSDNDSEQDIAGLVASFADSRIIYVRTDRFLPVTDNWNNALAHSTGDYVLMLGDDDGLVRGALSRLRELVDQFGQPDAIYTGAFLYAYPGVIPGYPNGYLQPNCNPAFRTTEPFWLPPSQALELVRDSMNLRMRFAYNMQHSLVSRRLIQSLADKGPFYQSPYPDFYATNVLFLKAPRLLICQQPLVTIGISAKSYGYFHFNAEEKDGVAFLNNTEHEPSQPSDRLLPGARNNTSWLLAMQSILVNYGGEHTLRVGYRRYRWLQMLNVYKNVYFDRRLGPGELRELRRLLTVTERVLYGPFLRAAFSTMRLLPHTLVSSAIGRFRRAIGQYAAAGAESVRPELRSVLDVYEHVDALGD